MRHFIRGNMDGARHRMLYALSRLLILLVPVYNYVARVCSYANRKTNLSQDGAYDFLFYDVANHRKSIEPISGQRRIFIRIRNRVPHGKDDWLLCDGANPRIAITTFLYGLLLFAALVRRQISKGRMHLLGTMTFFYELMVYAYTRQLLEALGTMPRHIYLSDSYSTRDIAIIDYYREHGIVTNMVQHGLIQGVNQYKSHADNYFVWSEFERRKIERRVRHYTRFIYIDPPLLCSNNSFDADDPNTLLVLSPINGMGRAYPDALYKLIACIANKYPISIRLHPSDNKIKFKSDLMRFTAADIGLSCSTWQEDLNAFSYFLVLASTCTLDILNSRKAVATFGMKTLGYPLLKICRPELLADINSLADFAAFRANPGGNWCDEIIAGTLGRGG
jgi:hypothetical protein